MHLTLSASAFAQVDGGTRHALAPRDAALLAWLALEGPTPRARLATLLWPDSDADAARNALRQRLFQLRKQIGVDLVAGSTTLALADGVTHDLEQADQVLGDGPPVAAGEFADWLAQQRRRRQTRLRQSLVDLAQMAEVAGDWPDAVTHAQELLALEPLSEEAHRRLMRLHYLAGDRAAALLAFDRCEQVLKDEIGARPSAETLALLATIEAGTIAAPAVGGALPASVLRPPRMIGRDRELAALAQGWAAGQVVAVIGEAGLGKTRLLQTFIDGHPGVVRAAGRPGDAGVPFATLARLLRAVLALADTASDALVLPSRGEIARVLPEFDAGGARPAGEGQRLQLQRALRQLLAAQPKLAGLIVDDLHFADEASLEMLGALIDPGEADADAVPDLRWALAYRPAEAGSPVQALHDGLVEQTRLAPLVLAPLDEAALAALVDSLDLPGVDGKALAPGLRRRTGGNPLFVLETLKQAWVERTLAQLADTKNLPRPVSVGRLIERRVAQLSPGALTLARVASIAGVDFSIALAEHVLGVSAMQFADALNELESAQVLRGTQFAHDLVHDAVHGSVPQAIARHTHGQVAMWLEQHGGEPARIASHFVAADMPARAVPWLGRAADAAAAAVRRKEQIQFLDAKSRIEAALAEAGQPGAADQAFETLMEAAELEVTLQDSQILSLGLCDRLTALARTPAQRARAELQRAHRDAMHGDFAAAEASARQVLSRVARERLPPAVAFECRVQLGTVLLLTDRETEAIPHLEASLAWVDEGGDPGRRCEMHGNLASAYDGVGRPGDALPHHETSLALARAVGHHGNEAMCLTNYAASLLRAGRLRDGERVLAEVKLLRTRDDSLSSIDGFVAMNSAIIDYLKGHLTSALSTLGLAEDTLGRFAPGFAAVAAGHRATIWAHAGQWARVQAYLAGLDPSTQVTGLELARRARLQWLLALGLERPLPVTPMREALQAIGPTDSVDQRDALRIDLAEAASPDEAIADMQDLSAEAAAAGREGGLLMANAVLARAFARSGAASAARTHLQALTDIAPDLAGAVGSVRHYALHPVWLAVQALCELGDEVEAGRWAARAKAWIEQTAEHHVPEAFRDSFRYRNPVNRELLALAARLLPH